MSVTKISLQEWSDKITAPEYQQPLKTLDEAVAAHGWEHVDHPECCGQPVDIQAFLGDAYYVGCKHCGKFMVDQSGPRFGNGHVSFLDGDKIDLETEATWITGIAALEDVA